MIIDLAKLVTFLLLAVLGKRFVNDCTAQNIQATLQRFFEEHHAVVDHVSNEIEIYAGAPYAKEAGQSCPWQFDEQSGMHTIRELERIRDRNLAGIIRALEANDWGAGAALKAQRRRLQG